MDLAALQRELARGAVGLEAPSESVGSPPPDQLEAFARSLVRKRAGEVRALLPRTAAALGERFSQTFASFARGRPTSGAKRHARDAIAFARWIQGQGLDAAAEIARYESAWVEMGLGRRWLIRRFRRRVDQAGPAASSGALWMAWWRAPWGGGIYVRRLWPPGSPGRHAELDKSGAQERT